MAPGIAGSMLSVPPSRAPILPLHFRPPLEGGSGQGGTGGHRGRITALRALRAVLRGGTGTVFGATRAVAAMFG